jgi:hypothetical protein
MYAPAKHSANNQWNMRVGASTTRRLALTTPGAADPGVVEAAGLEPGALAVLIVLIEFMVIS